MLQALAQIVVERMAAGALELTGTDAIRLFDLMHRIEEAEAREAARLDLAQQYRRALELLADVVGALATERMRLEVRGELRRLEGQGRRGAMLAREAARRWNDIAPFEHELPDGLSVAN